MLYALADGGDHRRGIDKDRVARWHRRAAPGGVRLAEPHHVAGKLPVVQRIGSEQLQELDAIFECHHELFLVSRHIATGTTIDEPHMLNARDALRRSGDVHSRVAATDDDDIRAKIQRAWVLFESPEELERIKSPSTLERRAPWRPSSDRYDHVRIALIEQLLGVSNLCVSLKCGPIGFAKLDVVVDGLIRDTKVRDDMAHDATKLAGALKNRRVHTGT